MSQRSTGTSQTSTWDEFKITYLPRIMPCFFGLVAIRVWTQCCLYDRYTASDFGIMTIAASFARVGFIAVLLVLAIGHPFSDKAKSILASISTTFMTAAAILYLLQPTCPNLPLSLLASIAAGVGIVWGGGVWIEFFIRLEPGEALIYTFGCLGISALCGLAIAQMNQTVAYAICVVMPTVSLLSYRKAQKTLDKRRSILPEPNKDCVYDNEPKTTIVRLIAGLCCLSFALGIARGFPNGSSLPLPLSYQVVHQVTIFLWCGLLIINVLVRGRGLQFGSLWRTQILLMVAGVALITTLDDTYLMLGGSILTISNTMMVGLLWYCCYDYGRHGSREAYIILGVTWIAHLLPREAGRWLILVVGPIGGLVEIGIACMVCLVSIAMAFVLHDSIPRIRPFFAELAGTQRSRRYVLQVHSENANSQAVSTNENAKTENVKHAPAPKGEGSVNGESFEDESEDEPQSEMLGIEGRCLVLQLRFGLTDRETDMVRFLARGRSRSYISNELFISENTVKSYTRNVYQKLCIHSKQELIDILEDCDN